MRIADVDLDTGHLFVRRLKDSLSTSQPLEGDEIRALRAWLRQRTNAPCCNSPLVFLSERGPMNRFYNTVRDGALNATQTNLTSVSLTSVHGEYSHRKRPKKPIAALEKNDRERFGFSKGRVLSEKIITYPNVGLPACDRGLYFLRAPGELNKMVKASLSLYLSKWA